MHQSLIFAADATNVTVTGGGTLDCNARPDTWWRCASDLPLPPCSGHGRPHCLMMSNVSGAELSRLHVTNSPDWTVHFTGCEDVHVHHLNVTNPSAASNADGIDIDSTQRALVEDSHFSVGDDALCVKSGLDWFGRTVGRAARDIVFRRNRIGTGHGITVGSEMSGGVYNVTFEDIAMDATQTGIRMKSMRGRGGEVRGVTYRRIDMRRIEQACVQITLHYRPANETNASATPTFDGIVLEDVRCAAAANSFQIDGLRESPVRRLLLRNVSLGAAVGPEAACEAAQCACERSPACPSCCKRK